MEFAVVAEDPSLRESDPAWDLVISALNTQVTQHAGPAWTLQATVCTYSSPALVPTSPGVVPVIVMRTPPAGVTGCHKWQGNSASAVVGWAPDGGWSVSASHEIIETLVDPTLESLRDGPDPGGGSATVQVLLEVCDPCEGTAYPVTPGSQIQVSDFCLPMYYEQNSYGPYTRCGQTLHLWAQDAIVSTVGYLTFSKPDGWYQYFDGSVKGPVPRDELLANAMRFGTRGAVDRLDKFRKPLHLRRPRSRSSKSTKSMPENRALADWVVQIKK